LIRTNTTGPTRVLGFSSGGVVTLAPAAARPELAVETIAWEPAAIGVLPDADSLHDEMTAPMHAHLAAHPGDWTGATT